MLWPVDSGSPTVSDDFTTSFWKFQIKVTLPPFKLKWMENEHSHSWRSMDEVFTIFVVFHYLYCWSFNEFFHCMKFPLAQFENSATKQLLFWLRFYFTLQSTWIAKNVEVSKLTKTLKNSKWKLYFNLNCFNLWAEVWNLRSNALIFQKGSKKFF